MKYRKNYKKKNFTKSVKAVVRKMSETKCNSDPIAISSSTSTDGNLEEVAQIAQGTGGDQRIGSTVQLRRIKIAGVINCANASTFRADEVRLSLLYSSSKQLTSGDIVNYLTGSYDPKVFYPLHDRYYPITYDINADASGNQTRAIRFMINKKLRYYQKYSGATAGDLEKGHLYLIVGQVNNSNASCELDARKELWFEDL